MRRWKSVQPWESITEVMEGIRGVMHNIPHWSCMTQNFFWHNKNWPTLCFAPLLHCRAACNNLSPAATRSLSLSLSLIQTHWPVRAAGGILSVLMTLDKIYLRFFHLWQAGRISINPVDTALAVCAHVTRLQFSSGRQTSSSHRLGSVTAPNPHLSKRKINSNLPEHMPI